MRWAAILVCFIAKCLCVLIFHSSLTNPFHVRHQGLLKTVVNH